MKDPDDDDLGAVRERDARWASRLTGASRAALDRHLLLARVSAYRDVLQATAEVRERTRTVALGKDPPSSTPAPPVSAPKPAGPPPAKTVIVVIDCPACGEVRKRTDRPDGKRTSTHFRVKDRATFCEGRALAKIASVIEDPTPEELVGTQR
jgi:hypothetical protein